MRPLSAEEAAALVKAAPNQTMRAFFALAVTAGLRRGELLGLRWDDIDFARGTVKIERSAQRIAGQGVVLGEPKTRAGRRQIRVSQIALTELQSLAGDHEKIREVVGSTWNPSRVVFASSAGTIIEETQVTRAFRAACRAAGIEHARVHDLRHTTATLMMTEGLSPRIVQDVLGHANVAVTLGIYSHLTPALQDASATAMDRVFDGLIGDGREGSASEGSCPAADAEGPAASSAGPNEADES